MTNEEIERLVDEFAAAHQVTICTDEHWAAVDSFARKVAAQSQLEAYNHWLGFVKAMHAGMLAARDSAERDVEYCESHHDALQELQYNEKVAWYIYRKLLESYDAMQDSLLPEPVSS